MEPNKLKIYELPFGVATKAFHKDLMECSEEYEWYIENGKFEPTEELIPIVYCGNTYNCYREFMIVIHGVTISIQDPQMQVASYRLTETSYQQALKARIENALTWYTEEPKMSADAFTDELEVLANLIKAQALLKYI